jgi:hypothetical protein
MDGFGLRSLDFASLENNSQTASQKSLPTRTKPRPYLNLFSRLARQAVRNKAIYSIPLLRHTIIVPPVRKNREVSDDLLQLELDTDGAGDPGKQQQLLLFVRFPTFIHFLNFFCRRVVCRLYQFIGGSFVTWIVMDAPTQILEIGKRIRKVTI